jgi:predicted O-methyltransferase YrrM
MKQVSLTKEVDTYVESLFIKQKEALLFAIKNSKKHNLPPIQITPVMGKFLYLQAKMIQAKTILEIGTLGGYSTLWFAYALPEDGQITTIEHTKEYAEVAKENFKQAGKDTMIELIFGDAKEEMQKLTTSYDLIFIDANKEEYIFYIEAAIKLSHPGTIIICDNVIRNGGVLQEKPEKAYYKILADFNKKIANDPRLESTILPLTIPLTGRDYVDGLSISIVK